MNSSSHLPEKIIPTPPNPLAAFRIVMVETTHSGNIGAAARAMRIMGINQLYLVKPKKFPSHEATALASGATDILKNAHVCTSIKEAISDCNYIVGTSARSRHLSHPPQPLRRGVERIRTHLKNHPQSNIAILFGTERTGLTNQELDYCHELFYIPTENSYNSLNIAAAIQVVCYEIYQQLKESLAAKENLAPISSQLVKENKNQQRLATSEELEGFYQHLEETLSKIAFFKSDNTQPLMRKLRLLYQRSHLTQEEVNILRGIFTEIDRFLK